MRQCTYEAITKEGALGLYKGVSQPLIAAVPITVIAFSFTELAKSKLTKYDPNMSKVK